MASTDHPVAPEPEREVPPSEPTARGVEAAPLPPPRTSDVPPPPPPPRPPRDHDHFRVVDLVLRLLLLAAAVAAVVVMVTGTQTKRASQFTPFRPFFTPFPPFVLSQEARFQDSPAFIYFVAALSVAGLYAVITITVSLLALVKPSRSTKLLPHFVIFDVLLLGIVASAAGSAGAVVYIEIKGNSHEGWTEVCNVFGKFCAHVEASVAASIFASFVLALLVILSVHSLSKRIPKTK